MIEYQETKKIRMNNLKKFVIFKCKPYFVLLFLCFIISICYIIQGIISDSQALRNGIIFLVSIIILAGLLPFITYFRSYKTYIYPIKDVEETYLETLTIEREEDKFIFSNISTGNVLVIDKKEIKSVESYKNIIILTFIGRRHKILPNTEDIKKIFEDFF